MEWENESKKNRKQKNSNSHVPANMNKSPISMRAEILMILKHSSEQHDRHMSYQSYNISSGMGGEKRESEREDY